MKIAYVSAGTGSFYCGTCIRDEALIRGLRGLGHDVELVPLYLPWFTPDADAVAPNPTFLGGMSVYLRSQFPVLSKVPNGLIRSLDRPSLLRWVSRRFSGADPSELGSMTHDLLLGKKGPHRKEIERLSTWLKEVCKPDLVCLSNALLLSLAGPISEHVEVPVFCTLQGEEGYVDALLEPHKDNCWTLLKRHSADVAGFISVSQDTATRMSLRVQIAKERVAVVPNGVDLAKLFNEQPKQPERDGVVIGFMARMCQDKGLDQLVTSYIEICEGWSNGAREAAPKMLICGTLTPSDKDFVDAQKSKLTELGLRDRVEFHPNFPNNEKANLLRRMDILAVPGPETESFGLYVIEALACSVPVVAPNHAAFPEILKRAGGGRLYPPGSIEDLRDTILDLIQDPEERKVLGARGHKAVREYFTAERMADEVSAVFCGHTKPPKAGPTSVHEREQPGAL